VQATKALSHVHPKAANCGQWIGVECDDVGRIKVDPNLAVPCHPEIFAIGDTALALDANSKPLPGIAPVAKQQGRYVANLIKVGLRGAERIEPFHYRSYGNLATIGRKAAVIDFGWIHLRGLVAWVVWSVVHIHFLIGFRNRAMVALDWVWAYFTFSAGRASNHRITDLIFWSTHLRRGERHNTPKTIVESQPALAQRPDDGISTSRELAVG
jgi:NADH dehydrogenase FAD-containing subunit